MFPHHDDGNLNSGAAIRRGLGFPKKTKTSGILMGTGMFGLLLGSLISRVSCLKCSSLFLRLLSW